MITNRLKTCSLLTLLLLAALLAPALAAQSERIKHSVYFPARDAWQRKAPAEMGLDPAKLKEAVEWAEAHASQWDFGRDQLRVFGKTLGPLPAKRAGTNGLILRHGYIVAEFGDTKTNDPVYSVAKSFLSTTASIAFREGLIRNVDDRVRDYVDDGG